MNDRKKARKKERKKDDEIVKYTDFRQLSRISSFRDENESQAFL